MALASVEQDAQNFSKKLGLSSDLLILERAWEQEIGGMREFAKIAALDHGSLVIEVDSNVVMQEITLRRRELVRKVNKHLPTPFVQHITVKIAQHYGH